MSEDQEEAVVFFDLGDTLAAPVLSPEGRLIGLEADPTVFPVLERLKGRAVRLGLLSNTGEETEASMRKALEASGLYDYFEPKLLIYSSTLPKVIPGIKPAIKLKPKPDPSVFLYASRRAGVEPGACVFVGEDRSERTGAMAAGFRVSPHPALVEDVLSGATLRYVRVAPGPRGDSAAWRADLMGRPLVPLWVDGAEVIATVGAGTAGQLDDAGYLVTRLGAIDAPLTTELYLLRDDAQIESGFLSERGHSAQFFGVNPVEPAMVLDEPGGEAPGFASAGAEGSPSDWVLASTARGLLVALPAGRSVEEFHFRDAKHGHNLKLIASPGRLLPFAAEQRVGVSGGFKAAGWLAAEPAARDLSDDERRALEAIDGPLIRSFLDRFAGLAPLNPGGEVIRSRHIRHADNPKVVAAVAAELEALGLTVRRRRFIHEGRPLDNIEALLLGESPEAVLITAHLDSTAAAGGASYQPAHDPAPGADDDASGVAAVLALAQVLAARAAIRPFHRSARFVLFNAEEQGLVGSQVYAASAAGRDDPIVAVFQMDMVGFIGSNTQPPRPFEIHVGHDRPEVVEASSRLADLLVRYQPEVAPELRTPQIYTGEESPQGDPAAGRSDHASFQDHGYPACVLSEDFFSGPGHADPSPQPNPNYHRVTDQTAEYDYAAQIARCVGAGALALLAPQPDQGAETADQAGDQADWRQMDSITSLLRVTPTMTTEVDVRKAARARINASTWSQQLGQYSHILASSESLRSDSGEPPRADGINLLTGTPCSVEITSPAGYEMGGDMAPADRIGQALELAKQVLTPDGFIAGEPLDFLPDPLVQKTSAGIEAVQLNQQYRGVPYFQMSRTVRFKPGSNKVEFVGDHVANLDSSFEVRPARGAKEALNLALAKITAMRSNADHHDHWSGETAEPDETAKSPGLDGYEPLVEVAFLDQPSQPTVFARGILGAAIPAHLVIMYADRDTARLAWKFEVTMPHAFQQYLVIVSADAPEPEILLAQETTRSATTQTKTAGANRVAAKSSPPQPRATTSRSATGAGAALPTHENGDGESDGNGDGHQLAATVPRAKVFFFSPRDGQPRKEVDFPLALNAYPLKDPKVPADFPRPWVSGDRMLGSNVIALLGEANAADPNSSLRGTMVGGRLTFDPASATGDDQKQVNIFFFCNYMHDFFYMLGFDEAAGNFQGDDPVIARAYPGTVDGTANMLTLPDGQQPRMNMGMVAATNRHTAMDADVVLHEYTHGLTNRLVGGRMNPHALLDEQSGSMGEGWSDYFALTIQNFGQATERTTTGDWVVNKPGKGIRRFPYDDVYPRNHGDMRTNPQVKEVHNAGEIWCAALMHMNRKLGEALGDKDRGTLEGWQVVVDSLKICPVNPSFLEARDAILAAAEARHAAGILTDQEAADCYRAIWTAFAGFGMGFGALRRGSDFDDALNDFHLPDDLGGEEISRLLPTPNAHVGGISQQCIKPTDFAVSENPFPDQEDQDRTDHGDDPDFEQLATLWSQLTERERGRLLGLLEREVAPERSRPARKPQVAAEATLNA